MSLPAQERALPHEKIVTPLIHVFDEASPQSSGISISTIPSKKLKQSLDDLFPEQQYNEKRTQEARKILGEKAKNLTDQQLNDISVEIECLVKIWIDQFEKKMFAGKTLNELLHDKGGL
jgi:hypothetical protein